MSKSAEITFFSTEILFGGINDEICKHFKIFKFSFFFFVANPWKYIKQMIFNYFLAANCFHLS